MQAEDDYTYTTGDSCSLGQRGTPKGEVSFELCALADRRRANRFRGQNTLKLRRTPAAQQLAKGLMCRNLQVIGMLLLDLDACGTSIPTATALVEKLVCIHFDFCCLV